MSERGLVIARHRRHVTIEDEQQIQHRGLMRGRQVNPLVGDEVVWKPQPDGTAVVESILPRRSLLTRIDSRGRPEGVAANLTQLVIVAAPEPAPDWLLVDRYLVAVELLRINALIAWNKCELGAGALRPCYAAMGYTVVGTSAKTGAGIDDLAARMRDQRSTLVGQSGVGKSSLINTLLGAELQTVGALSEKGGQGRHTTTTSALYRLPGGGELIDSPGVRQYAPHLEETEGLDRGFREFQPLLGHCRFDDCVHEAEPDCAVKLAVDDGRIDAERYRSYLKLRETLAGLQR
jgi:ribosome biogenesis GTPase